MREILVLTEPSPFTAGCRHLSDCESKWMSSQVNHFVSNSNQACNLEWNGKLIGLPGPLLFQPDYLGWSPLYAPKLCAVDTELPLVLRDSSLRLRVKTKIWETSWSQEPRTRDFLFNIFKLPLITLKIVAVRAPHQFGLFFWIDQFGLWYLNKRLFFLFQIAEPINTKHAIAKGH